MGTDMIVGAALLAQVVVAILVWILAKRGSREQIAALQIESQHYERMWREQLNLNIDQSGAMGEAVLKMYQAGTDDGRAMGPEPDNQDAQNDTVWSRRYPHEPREWNYGDNTHPTAVASDLVRFRQALRQLDGLPDFDYQGIPRVSL